MADFIVQATLSNLLVSTILALIAWLVQSRFQAPSLANLLWILVLVKMVTPPLVSLPVLEIQTISNAPAATVSTQPVDALSDLGAMNFDANELPSIAVPTDLAFEHPQPADSVEPGSGFNLFWLGIAWLITSGGLFLISFCRISRFHLVLRKNIKPASAKLVQIAERVATQVELRRKPEIVITQANVSPFVWWIGGVPKIVIPESAIESLSVNDIRMVLAHEMAHIKRHDHWIRWLEWFTLLGLWWNPVMWWARKQLRVTEEIACDALVVEKTRATHHDYANSLLNMADILTTSAIRPPAVASAMNSGGLLEKRLKMLIANKTLKVPFWIRAAICVGALAVFPLGLVYAQDFDAIERRLERAVKAGELSMKEAETMLRALGQDSDAKQEAQDLEDLKRKYDSIAAELEREVAAGNLSKKDAARKLKKIERQLFDLQEQYRDDVGKQREADKELADLEAQYKAIADELKQAVKHEKISAEEAELKLREIEKKMFEKKSARDDNRKKMQEAAEMEDVKRQYEAIANDIMQAVDQGKISGEDAELKLHELQKKLFEKQKEKQRDDWHGYTEGEAETLKRWYENVVETYKREVERGEMSPDEADRKLAELEKQLLQKHYSTQQQASDEMAARKREYEAYANDILRQVDQGELSEKKAKQYLKQLQNDIFGDQKKKEKEKNRQDLEELERQHKVLQLHYEDVVRAIEEKIAEGEMSKKEGRMAIEDIKAKLDAEYGKRSQADSDRAAIQNKLAALKSQIRDSEQSLADAEQRYKQLQMKLKELESIDRR